MPVAEKEKQNLPPRLQAVAAVLREGKSNATVAQDIMKLAGVKDKRQVHEIIERLINDFGFVIGSSRRGEYRGYYIVSNDREFQETAATYNEQIQSMLKRHRNLQKNYSAGGR